jgi:hypothetical protein
MKTVCFSETMASTYKPILRYNTEDHHPEHVIVFFLKRNSKRTLRGAFWINAAVRATRSNQTIDLWLYSVQANFACRTQGKKLHTRARTSELTSLEFDSWKFHIQFRCIVRKAYAIFHLNVTSFYIWSSSSMYSKWLRAERTGFDSRHVHTICHLASASRPVLRPTLSFLCNAKHEH